MTEVELAWFAGLVEGEGCFFGTKDGRSIVFTIGMTDLDVIEKAMALWPGIGYLYHQDRSHLGTKTLHTWRVTKRRHVWDIATSIWPHMGRRRREQITRTFDGLNNFDAHEFHAMLNS